MPLRVSLKLSAPRATMTLSAILPVFLGTLLISAGQAIASNTPTAQGSKASDSERPERTDLYGDPLPRGVVARMGTIRLRHGSLVSSLVFSGDGKTLISASYDDTIRFWDTASGKEVRRLSRPIDGQVWCIAISPDGQTLAVGGSDHFLHLYSLPTGEKLRRCGFRGGLGGFNSVTFSPDGSTVAAGSIVKKVGVWAVHTGEERLELREHQDRVNSVAFSPDGKLLVSGGMDKVVRVWDIPSGNLVRELKGHEGGITSVAFTSNQETLVTAGSDGSIRLWDPATGALVRKSKGLQGPIKCMVVSRNSKLLVYGTTNTTADLSGGATIGLLDVATGENIGSLPGHRRQVSCLAFSPDGSALASGGADNLVRLWDVDKEREMITPGCHFPVRALAISPDGSMMATAGIGAVSLWETSSGRELRRVQGDYGEIHSVAISPTGTKLMWTGKDRIHVWNTRADKELCRFQGHESEVVSAVFSPDEGKVVSAGRDQTIRFWDVTTGKALAQLGVPEVDAFAYTLSPDSKSLAVLTAATRTLSLWSLTESTELRRLLPVDHQRVASVAFSPDSKSVACGDQVGTVVVWDTVARKEVLRFPSGDTSLHAVAFSPDGRTIASGSREGKIRLWEVATGKERCLLGEHAGVVWALAFSKNGKILASGSGDTTALVWDLTGRSLIEQGARFSAQQINAMWDDLAAADSRTAHRAILTMSAAPEESVALLRVRLRPVQPVDKQELANLIAELGDDQFQVRERATQKLEKIGEAAEAALREALAGESRPESRRRLTQLLEGTKGSAASPERLRATRAIEVLERIGTPEARRLLTDFAKGVPGASITAQARVALQRLEELTTK